MKNSVVLVPFSLVNDACIDTLFACSQEFRYMDILQHIQSLQASEIRSYMQQANKHSFAIVLQQSQQVCGFISALHVFAHSTATLSFMILPEFRGRGYMKEALLQFVQYGSNQLAVVRFEAQVYVGNGASVRLLASCGFVCEGELRKNFMIDSVLCNSYMYAKIVESPLF